MLPPIADYNLGDGLITVVAIFFAVIWFWILVTILTDLFRDHELSGWVKALWVLFLLIGPFLASFIYLIARGNGMRDRSLAAQAELREQIIASGGGSPADELAKLDTLKGNGSLTDAEYQTLKAKIVS
jgi:ABC-type transport system involved in cytochrome bd biosynthesis fused ATPase/permease subunit